MEAAFHQGFIVRVIKVFELHAASPPAALLPPAIAPTQPHAQPPPPPSSHLFTKPALVSLVQLMLSIMDHALVYGFGVVLLEMLTGMRALDTKRPTGQQNLVEWVKPCLSNKKLKTIMDAKIEGQYS
ncbi:hypothetical protein RJT34_16371 [Clitoria ternatea]|uniref:Serine-threonine/tyrosine-protein kinase catalytic domain-containing protein n=1 Tax=Clitoria ternatea TaxID=43366 RepID=A0AAN9J883_CLITE